MRSMHFLLVRILLFTPFLLEAIYGAYFSQFSMKEPDNDPCFDRAGRPTRCVPDFINAAFGKPVIASSTCGTSGTPSKFVNAYLFFKPKDVCASSKKNRFIRSKILTKFPASGKSETKTSVNKQEKKFPIIFCCFLLLLLPQRSLLFFNFIVVFD